MRVSDAFKQGIARIRLPIWNPYAYLELRTNSNGSLSPMGVLHDIHAGREGIDVPLWRLDETTWEPWTEPSDFAEHQHIYDKPAADNTNQDKANPYDRI